MLNIRSIKKRNQPRLKRSAGRVRLLFGLDVPDYSHVIKVYNEWFDALIAKEFGWYWPLTKPAPNTSQEHL